MTETIVHFVFTLSGAGCLGQALRKAGRDDRMVVIDDDMQYGPIDPGDSASRAKWVESELGLTDWNIGDPNPYCRWNEDRFPNHRKVVWLTRRIASEYAGFLHWLWAQNDVPCDMVDLSEVKISYPPERNRSPRLAISVCMLHHDTIAENKLWDLAEPLHWAERRRYRMLWEKLRSENAALRITNGKRLISAPISLFDPLLLSSLRTDEWQKLSRVIAWAATDAKIDDDDDLIQTDDAFLRVASMHWPKPARSKSEAALLA